MSNNLVEGNTYWYVNKRVELTRGLRIKSCDTPTPKGPIKIRLISLAGPSERYYILRFKNLDSNDEWNLKIEMNDLTSDGDFLYSTDKSNMVICRTLDAANEVWNSIIEDTCDEVRSICDGSIKYLKARKKIKN